MDRVTRREMQKERSRRERQQQAGGATPPAAAAAQAQQAAQLPQAQAPPHTSRREESGAAAGVRPAASTGDGSPSPAAASLSPRRQMRTAQLDGRTFLVWASEGRAREWTSQTQSQDTS